MASSGLPVRTERLVLRGFEPTDLDAVTAYSNLPDVRRYLEWKARDAVECRAALAAMCSQRRLNRPGDTLVIAIARRADRAVIGQASLTWTDATAAQAELRFALDPRYRGQGFAGEALRAVLDIGFGELRFHRIFARCSGKHPHSARLLQGLGMRLEAHFREHALFQGEWDEEMHFAILDREWQRGAKVKELSRHLAA